MTAVWVNQPAAGDWKVYAATWNGANWAAPVEIAGAVMVDAPVVTYDSANPVVVWAQDTDGEAGDTYFYVLEDVDIHGASTYHGPVDATVEPGRPFGCGMAFGL